MTSYVDASVMLRWLLRQPGQLSESGEEETRVSSELVVVECRRAIDRYRVRGELSDGAAEAALERLAEMVEGMELIEMTPPVFRRASEPLPVELATLDALHLASALLWRDPAQGAAVMATHDTMLARAARLMGLKVIGV